MDKPLRPMVNRFCGFSVWALAPFLLLLVFCCLLRCFLWRNASLAGGFAGRRVWFVSVVLVCCCNRFACSNGHDLSLYKCLSSLCSCKDRASSATSATLEEKKSLHQTKRSGAFSFPITHSFFSLQISSFDVFTCQLVQFARIPRSCSCLTFSCCFALVLVSPRCAPRPLFPHCLENRIIWVTKVTVWKTMGVGGWWGLVEGSLSRVSGLWPSGFFPACS